MVETKSLLVSEQEARIHLAHIDMRLIGVTMWRCSETKPHIPLLPSSVPIFRPRYHLNVT